MKSYKPKNNRSSNTNNFIYYNKPSNKKNVYVCECNSCNEMKYKELTHQSSHSMTLQKTQSNENINYIYYGSERKRISFQEFFNILSSGFDDEDDEDYDERYEPPSKKKEEYLRRPLGLRLPI